MRETRNFIITAIIIISSVFISAGDLDLGIKLGYDHDQIRRSYAYDNLNGFKIGIFGEQKMSDFHSLRLELGYTFRGTQSVVLYEMSYFDFYDDYYSEHSDIGKWGKGQYLNLTGMTKLFPPVDSWIIPYIYFGPALYFLVNDMKLEYIPGDLADGYDFKPDRFDFYYAIGGGFDMKNEGLSFDLRFLNELTSSSYGGMDDKNNFISMTVGFKLFSLHKLL